MESPEITSFELNGKDINGEDARMAGWRSQGRCLAADFLGFEQAGVRNILVEGGVGVINRNFALRDLIPDDYIDFSMRKDVSLSISICSTSRNRYVRLSQGSL